MPVITIKLNDKVMRGHESINTKLASNEMLRLVGCSYFIKNSVPNPFRDGFHPFLLLLIHTAQPLATFRISVTAFKRAVEYIVLCTREGHAKVAATNFAGIRDFVAALPLDLMFNGAKISSAASYHAARPIETLTAIMAGESFSIVSRRLVALVRAKPLIDRHSLRDTLAAMFTNQRSNASFRGLFTLVHTVNYNMLLRQVSRYRFSLSTSKPVELFAVPILQHTRPGELVYEPQTGYQSQFVAAEQNARLCYGNEIAAPFVAVILERLQGLGLSPQLVAPGSSQETNQETLRRGQETNGKQGG